MGHTGYSGRLIQSLPYLDISRFKAKGTLKDMLPLYLEDSCMLELMFKLVHIIQQVNLTVNIIMSSNFQSD